MRIDLDSRRFLRAVAESDLDEIFELTVANRDHLVPWMPWAAEPRRELTADFLRAAVGQAESDDGFQAAIVEDGRIQGVTGYHSIDRRNRVTTIGYWLAADAQGKGTMTLAVAALIDHAIAAWDIHRIEIRAAPGNLRSRALPERLGFTQEGVLREAERFEDRYEDLVVYSLLAPEWQARGR